MKLFLLYFKITPNCNSAGYLVSKNADGSGCPAGYAYILGSCYWLTDFPMMWMDAAVACAEQNGSLASFTSEEQNRWVYEYFASFGWSSYDLWIGLNDISQEGTMEWIDSSGNDSAFSYWYSGQPDNSGGQENCVVFWNSRYGKWNDYLCSNTYPGICRYVAPEPHVALNPLQLGTYHKTNSSFPLCVVQIHY